MHTPVVACRNTVLSAECPAESQSWNSTRLDDDTGTVTAARDATPRRCCELCRRTLQRADSRFRRGMWLDHKSLHVLVVCGHSDMSPGEVAADYLSLRYLLIVARWTVAVCRAIKSSDKVSRHHSTLWIKKLCHFYFYCNFGKCWSIFKILSMSESKRNGS